MNLDKPVSKVLVLDDDPLCADRIKAFCESHNLVPLKVRPGATLSVLGTNIDLGGILFAEDYAGSLEESLDIANAIHLLRPELPIFLRRRTTATLTDLPGVARNAFSAAYVIDDMAALGKVVDEYIFCLIYPNALLRGIAEIIQSVLAGQFKRLTVTMNTPYIVHDRLIFGEVLSLIPLESAWCRGYMMIQGQEAELCESIGMTSAATTASQFRGVNDLLSEITNLIWGAFKNRYIGDRRTDGERHDAAHVQIPLIVNHAHQYISFGTKNPQLCFRFNLTQPENGTSTVLYARFVFNLNWAPESFTEFTREAVELVESGEMEFF
jgi:hypothetical protein